MKHHTEEEVLAFMLNIAKEDERIRAVSIEGSRADPKIQKDQYMDYDISYYVEDIAPFYNKPEWVLENLHVFGKPLIMQMPEAMRDPYGDGNFNYMMVYPSGIRIDLSFCKDKYEDDGEPSVTLLDKDNGKGFRPPMPPPSDMIYHIKPPSPLYYYSCCNDFWWCLNNVAKGIARDELPYTMSMINEIVRSELHDMIKWYIGVENSFELSVGKDCKYIKHYLPPDLYAMYAATYAGSDYNELWASIYVMCDLFHILAIRVAEHFGFIYRQEEENGIRIYMDMVKNQSY